MSMDIFDILLLFSNLCYYQQQQQQKKQQQYLYELLMYLQPWRINDDNIE
jgi:hypothetical protein